jgi:hypothetical protein
VAKAAFWAVPDAEARERGEQTGLDTQVVHAVNDVHPVLGGDCAARCLSLRDECTAWGVRPQG